MGNNQENINNDGKGAGDKRPPDGTIEVSFLNEPWEVIGYYVINKESNEAAIMIPSVVKELLADIHDGAMIKDFYNLFIINDLKSIEFKREEIVKRQKSC